MSCGKRTEASNAGWRAKVGRKFGEGALKEMLDSPTPVQRCWRCGKHFGLECLCHPCELREWVEVNGLPGCFECIKLEAPCDVHQKRRERNA